MKKSIIAVLFALGFGSALRVGCVSSGGSPDISAVTTNVNGIVQAAFLVVTDESLIPHTLLASLIRMP